MTDNRLITQLMTPQHAAQALQAYGIYLHAMDIYRRTKAVMKQRPIGFVKSSNTTTVWVNSDAYASSKIYTHQ